MNRPTTWEEVESLTRELLALENLSRTSPQAYVRSCIEERLAQAHERRHWEAVARERSASDVGWLEPVQSGRDSGP
jgi:hypothetical protein